MNRPRIPALTWVFATVAAAVVAVVLVVAQRQQEPVPTVSESVVTTAAAATSLAPGDPSQERSCRDMPYPRPAASVEVERLVAGMELTDKISQLFVVGFHGTSVDTQSSVERTFNEMNLGRPTIGDAIAARALGGVVLFGRNIVDANQLAAFTDELQAAAGANDHTGLLVVVDHEGGQVTRIKADFTNYPAAPVFGSLDDPALTQDAAAATADQLRALGVNVILAPVADVARSSTEGPLDDRTYGSDAALVAEAVAATVRGFDSERVAAAVKHFPGLGATSVDSHVAMPSLSIAAEEWDTIDRVPFATAVATGARLVLVGHTRVPALDPTGTPSSVSAPVISGELRRCLGFGGVVITDALDMAAVGSIGSQGTAAVQALAAGVDLILAPRSLDEAAAAVLQAINDGDLPEERIDEAVTRVLGLKHELGILDAAAIGPNRGVSGIAEQRHTDVLQRVEAACLAKGIDDC